MNYDRYPLSFWDQTVDATDDLAVFPEDKFQIIPIPDHTSPYGVDIPYRGLIAPPGFTYNFKFYGDDPNNPFPDRPQTIAWLVPSFAEYEWKPDPNTPDVLVRFLAPEDTRRGLIPYKDLVARPPWRWEVIMVEYTSQDGWFFRGSTVVLRFAYLVPDITGDWFPQVYAPNHPGSMAQLSQLPAWRDNVGGVLKKTETVLVINVAGLQGYPFYEAIHFGDLRLLPPGFMYTYDAHGHTAYMIRIPNFRWKPTGYSGGAA